ncbi:MAG: hypothetical protein LBH97_00625 [Treponema sp.]|nr:hypothetical protein [Treponema sp.]
MPRNSGYIVSSFFKEGSTYSVYEIVSYSDVKEITSVGNGLQFTAKSKKLCVLVEPPAYTEKHVEPLNRKEGESIPYSESELEIIKGIDQTRIMVSREPKEGPGSFTVLKPAGSGFSVVFNALPDIHQKLSAFFKYSLNLERRIPLWDAEKAAQLISRTVEKTLSFQGAL